MKRILLCAALVACSSTPSEEVPPPEPPRLEVGPVSLDVGRIACGLSETRTVALANRGGEPLVATLRSTLPGVTVTPSWIELAPSEQAAVTVEVAAPLASIPGTPSRGDLVIASDGGGVTLPVAFEAGGATLALPTVIDMGSTLPGGQMIRTFVVGVEGTEPLTLALDPPAAPFRLSASTATIQPGTTQTLSVALDTDATPQTFTSQVPVRVTAGTLCAPAPAPVPVVAVTDADLVSFDRTSIEFGKVKCNLAARLDLGVANHTNTLFDYHASFADGHLRSVDGFLLALDQRELFGTFASGLVVDPIPVAVESVPKRLDLPPGIYTSTLELRIEQLVRTFPVRAELLRPILTPASESISFGAADTRTVDVANTGNDLAAVTVSPPTGITVSPQSFTLQPGQAASITVVRTAAAALPSSLLLTHGCNDPFTPTNRGLLIGLRP